MSFLRATQAPPTLTPKERHKLLTETGRTKGAEREFMIYSLALGTAMREGEIVALNVGDVLHAGGIRSKFHLVVYKGSSIRVRPARAEAPARSSKRKTIRQAVYLPKAVRRKLAYYLKWKKDRGQAVRLEAPLFVTTKDSGSSYAGDRLSTRALRHHFRLWQKRCAFETLHGFHVLRHTALSEIYRRTKDLRLTQVIARHVNVNTTEIYTHKTDSEIAGELEDLPC